MGGGTQKQPQNPIYPAIKLYLKQTTKPLRVQSGGKAPGILYVCWDGNCVVGFKLHQVLTCDFALCKVWLVTTQPYRG